MPSASALEKMIPLLNHQVFESLFSPGPSDTPLSNPVLIAFSASWCGPCQKINWDFILDEFSSLPVYYCDIDTNKYTPGFCNIKSIPSILMLTPPKGGVKTPSNDPKLKSNVIGPFQSSDTAKICSWIQIHLKQAN